MNTLIVYATKHGCTETCAQMLSKKLTGNVELCNLKGNPILVLSNYDTVIIGGPIHIGKIKKVVSEFCSSNSKELENKRIGLFVCGMLFERANEELSNSFPKELFSRAVAKEFFGGEYRFDKMSSLDRWIVKKVAKVDNDLSQISEEKLNQFASLMNNCDIELL